MINSASPPTNFTNLLWARSTSETDLITNNIIPICLYKKIEFLISITQSSFLYKKIEFLISKIRILDIKYRITRIQYKKYIDFLYREIGNE